MDPDIVLEGDDDRLMVDIRRDASAHEIHPDLAILLTTSGSTGSPRLVRLSYRNVSSNASAIAGYLDLGPTDRGMLNLPLHYCYGLSVLNSHLTVGCRRGRHRPLGRRRVLLDADGATPASRVSRGSRTRSTCSTPRVSPTAGPDISGMSPRRAASSRRSGSRGTCSWGSAAGGTSSSCMARRNRRPGWPTCPSELAHRHPSAIGLAIPGGSLRLEPVDEIADPTVGELVYSGPNVMMGYACTPDRPRARRGTHRAPHG